MKRVNIHPDSRIGIVGGQQPISGGQKTKNNQTEQDYNAPITTDRNGYSSRFSYGSIYNNYVSSTTNNPEQANSNTANGTTAEEVTNIVQSVITNILKSYQMGEGSREAEKLRKDDTKLETDTEKEINDNNGEIQDIADGTTDNIEQTEDQVTDIGESNEEIQGEIEDITETNAKLIKDAKQTAEELNNIGFEVDDIQDSSTDINPLENGENNPVTDSAVDELLERYDDDISQISTNNEGITELTDQFESNVRDIKDRVSSAQEQVSSAQSTISSITTESKTLATSTETKLTADATGETINGTVNTATSTATETAAKGLEAAGAIPGAGAAANAEAQHLHEISDDSGITNGTAKENFINSPMFTKMVIETTTKIASTIGNGDAALNGINDLLNNLYSTALQYAQTDYGTVAEESDKPMSNESSKPETPTETPNPTPDNTVDLTSEEETA